MELDDEQARSRRRSLDALFLQRRRRRRAANRIQNFNINDTIGTCLETVSHSLQGFRVSRLYDALELGWVS